MGSRVSSGKMSAATRVVQVNTNFIKHFNLFLFLLMEAEALACNAVSPLTVERCLYSAARISVCVFS